jgi:hypothetical protein
MELTLQLSAFSSQLSALSFQLSAIVSSLVARRNSEEELIADSRQPTAR